MSKRRFHGLWARAHTKETKLEDPSLELVKEELLRVSAFRLPPSAGPGRASGNSVSDKCATCACSESAEPTRGTYAGAKPTEGTSGGREADPLSSGGGPEGYTGLRRACTRGKPRADQRSGVLLRSSEGGWVQGPRIGIAHNRTAVTPSERLDHYMGLVRKQCGPTGGKRAWDDDGAWAVRINAEGQSFAQCRPLPIPRCNMDRIADEDGKIVAGGATCGFSSPFPHDVPGPSAVPVSSSRESGCGAIPISVSLGEMRGGTFMARAWRSARYPGSFSLGGTRPTRWGKAVPLYTVTTKVIALCMESRSPATEIFSWPRG